MARTTDFIYSRINDSLPARGKFLFSGPRMEYVLYTVVGGGTAGSVLASRLAEDANRTILVIEAGGFRPPTQTSKYQSSPTSCEIPTSSTGGIRPFRRSMRAKLTSTRYIYSSQTKSPEPAVTALTTGLKL